MKDLIERLEKAVGPSRVLDFEIHIAAVGDPLWPVTDMKGRVTNPNSRMSDYLATYREVIDSDDQDFDFPRYTASLDAAMTLVPKDWHVSHAYWDHAQEPTAVFNLTREMGVYANATAKTPAIALCIAATHSRSVEEPKE